MGEYNVPEHLPDDFLSDSKDTVQETNCIRYADAVKRDTVYKNEQINRFLFNFINYRYTRSSSQIIEKQMYRKIKGRQVLIMCLMSPYVCSPVVVND